MQKNSLIYKKKGSVVGNVLMWAAMCIIIVLSVARIFISVNYLSICVVGTSMEGTLSDGDYLYAIKNSSPRRGDIVIIETEKKTLIKRVIGLGGDTVELKAGVLYLNGEKVDEPYVESKNNKNIEKNTYFAVVAEGDMFFLGDNRDVSVDSRLFVGGNGEVQGYGMLPVTSVLGVVADWSLSLKGAVTAINRFSISNYTSEVI